MVRFKTGKWICIMVVISLLLGVNGCGMGKDTMALPADKEETGKITIGFSQLGAESDWRTANTESMKATFTKEKGYNLILEDGQQKQSNQITAVRTFIQQDVDYIVLAPVTETGWDTVLQEAKDAGIPVIIVDRMVDVEDSSLFSCWVGSDFELEGRKMAEWIHQFALAGNISSKDLNIVNIQGTLGASAQIGRSKGLKEAAEKYDWNLLAEVCGEFTQAKGREVMEDMLEQYDNINVVYCENDNSAFGAIGALESAGIKVGSNLAAGEVMVVSFDGVNKEAVQYVSDGKITCIAECNPIQGPLVEEIIRKLENGETPDKYSYIDEIIFSADKSVREITVEGKAYKVTILGE